MSEPLLSERSEWTGHWWRPDTPDAKVPGILRFDPRKGVSLRLIGGWDYRVTRKNDNGSTSVMAESQSWPMIHGQVENDVVTLLGVTLRSAGSFGLHNFSEPPTRMQLKAQTALVGALLTEPDEPAFIASATTVENLTQWSQYSGITMNFFAPVEVGSAIGSIEIGRLEGLTAELGTVTAKLHQLAWHPYAEQRRSGTLARIKEHASVEFVSEEPRPLDEWIGYLSAVGDLISLSTLSACALITMRVFLPPTPERYREGHPMRNQRHEVAVYTTRVVRPRPEKDAHDAWQMILTLDDLSFDQLLPRWMDIHERFASARGMILGLRYVTGGYLETQVVTAVAAAESFHRSLDAPAPIPEDEFKALRKLLLDAAPAKFKDWLAARIVRNEVTLKQRLVDLATRPGEFMAELVPDPDKWAKAAGDARNTLAHVGSSDQELEDLYVVVRVTEAVVIMNLLHELGVPAERLQKAIRDHRQLAHAADLGRKHYAAAYRK